MSARLADLRLAYSAFIDIEATVKDIITQLSATGSHSGMGGMPSTIRNLEAQDWPSRLAKAGEELKQVCMSATILPLPLLRLATTRAYSAVSLITQYKLTFDDLRLSQQSVGEMLNPTAQPPAQNMTPMNSFSSTDGVTFWPWREEV